MEQRRSNVLGYRLSSYKDSRKNITAAKVVPRRIHTRSDACAEGASLDWAEALSSMQSKEDHTCSGMSLRWVLKQSQGGGIN